MDNKLLFISNKNINKYMDIKKHVPIIDVIPGVILIFSCHKYLNSRLKEFRLSKNEYSGWKVFIIIGDPFLESEYSINDNLITIKCEDSYIHLTKKVVMAFKIILKLFYINEGILRCGDDLIFNEKKLELFLNKKNKSDYMGVIACKNKIIKKEKDMFMVNYFNKNPNDLLEKINGINYTLEEMQKFNQIPKCNYAGGVIVYYSKNSCNILINHMENINWNVFTKNDTYGYPYIIEDIGLGFILNNQNIYPASYNLYSNNEYDKNNINSEAFAFHTNKYK